MSKKLIIIGLLYFAVALSFGIGLGQSYASDITSADFYGIIRTTNNSTAVLNVSSNISKLDTSDLIAAGWLNASANNCAIRSSAGADMVFMPGWGPNPWMIFIPSLGPNSLTDSLFYTKDVTGGLIRYFPGSTGWTIPDGMTEPGNNFSFTFNDLFINTTANGTDEYILHHSDAVNGGLDIIKSGSVSGNITGRITTLAAPVNSSAYRPNAAGTYTELSPLGGTPANYVQAGDNNDATYVYTTTNVYTKDTYNTANHTTESGHINSVTIYFRIQNSSDTTYAKPLLLTHSILYEGTEQTTTAITTKNQVYAANPNTSTFWTWDEIDALQFGAEVKTSTPTTTSARLVDVWIIINYSPYVYTDVTATGVSTGEHDIVLKTEVR